MSERGIEVGDLVMVVFPTTCCGSPQTLGRVFKVMDICKSARQRCFVCGSVRDVGLVCDTGTIENDIKIAYEIRRLKRIPPLVEPESTTQTDEVTV